MHKKLTLEEFKKMDQKARYAYGKSLEMSWVYNDHGTVVSFKNIEGYWTIKDYDMNFNEISTMDSKGHWVVRTYDKNNKVLTYANSYNYSYEKTYDKFGNKLTYKDNSGYSYLYTYDKNGNEVAFKDSNDWYYIFGKETSKEAYESFINEITETYDFTLDQISHFIDEDIKDDKFYKYINLSVLRSFLFELANNINEEKIETTVEDYQTTLGDAINKTRKVIENYVMGATQYMKFFNGQVEMLNAYIDERKRNG